MRRMNKIEDLDEKMMAEIEKGSDEWVAKRLATPIEEHDFSRLDQMMKESFPFLKDKTK